MYSETESDNEDTTQLSVLNKRQGKSKVAGQKSYLLNESGRSGRVNMSETTDGIVDADKTNMEQQRPATGGPLNEEKITIA